MMTKKTAVWRNRSSRKSRQRTRRRTARRRVLAKSRPTMRMFRWITVKKSRTSSRPGASWPVRPPISPDSRSSTTMSGDAKAKSLRSSSVLRTRRRINSPPIVSRTTATHRTSRRCYSATTARWIRINWRCCSSTFSRWTTSWTHSHRSSSWPLRFHRHWPALSWRIWRVCSNRPAISSRAKMAPNKTATVFTSHRISWPTNSIPLSQAWPPRWPTRTWRATSLTQPISTQRPHP